MRSNTFVHMRFDRQERVWERVRSMLRWKTKWLHSTGEWPATLADTLDCINPTLYRNVNTILTILLTMPASTVTPERSFSPMHRVKTYLRGTMRTKRLGPCSNVRAQGHTHWRRGCGSSVLRQEQESKLWISIKLDLRYLVRHSVKQYWVVQYNPLSLQIRSRLLAKNSWREDILY